ncbi:MAG: T9SS type A sorting domain-containing protein [Cytophagaceae bacterium]|nr:T9SS type A sorting domain-containing protein [Cytophagaceae bacterium]
MRKTTIFTRKRQIYVFLLVLTLLLANTSLRAQNLANVWYFGNKTGLQFTGGTVTQLQDGPNLTGATGEGEGCTTISDGNGNLLFFTDGDNVYNRNRVVMPAGTGLTGSYTAAQSALIIAQPGSVNITVGGVTYPRYYYIFTVDATGATSGLRYSIVDMTLNGNLGDVTTKNTLVMANLTEGLVAIPHFNGVDTWIMARSPGTGNSYYAILVSSGGVAAPVVSSAGMIPNGTSTYMMKADPCYKRLAVVYHNNWNTGTGLSDNAFEILQFDNNTGVVSAYPTNLKITNVIQKANSADYRGIYGVEWSPNGRYLFISELVDNMIYQYDVYAGGTFPGTVGTLAAITASKQNLGTGPTVRTGHLQMGPDGKIYTAQHTWASGMSYVGVIANPNAFPATWNSTAYGWNFATMSGNVAMGLPTLPKSFSAANPTINPITSACVGNNIPLSYSYIGTIGSQTWSSVGGTFNPNATVAAPTVNYATAGSKTINLSVTDAVCGYTTTDQVTITVNNIVNSAGTVSCNPPRGTVTAPNGAYTYVWYADAAGTQPIATGTTNVSLPIGGSGNVYVRAETSVSSTPSSPTLRNTGTMNTWNGGAGTTVNFTVTNPITLNSFQWGNGSIPAWPYPATTYTVSVQNAAGTATYYTNSYTTAAGSSSYNTYTESGLNLVLPAGTYRLLYSSVGADWSVSTNASDANVNITGNPIKVGNFNYSITNYTVTQLPCSQMSAAINYNCPLPVTWLEFTGVHTSSGNLLHWSTAEEVNNSHFVVLRSLDAVNFEEIATVSGAGNTSQVSVYSYLDKSAPDGLVYYQIRQVDIDGTSSNSRIISVESEKSFTLSVYPNPNNGVFSVVMNGLADENSNLELVNSLGQVIFSQALSLESNVLEFNLSHLAKGVYYLKLDGTVKKIVVE